MAINRSIPPLQPPLAAQHKPKKRMPWLMRKLRQHGLLYNMEQQLPFTLFLTAVALFYIWNAHQAEKQARKADALQRELRELKSEYMTLSAQLSIARQHSQVAQVVDSLGLTSPEQPPQQLIPEEDAQSIR